jgi:DNA-binding transcriptional ArsR family regulator
MKEPPRSRPLQISDAQTAAALSHPLRRRLLLSLAAREASLAELARLTRVDLRRTHHHVIALLALGLVVVVRERPRAGRAIKIYRAVAQAFFIPQQLAPADAASPLADELSKSLARVREASRSGVLYDVDENGAPRMRAVDRSPSASVRSVEIWKLLRLSRSDALKLGGELVQCLRRYAERENERGESYLVHCAMAPRAGSRRGGVRRHRPEGR